MAKIDLLAHVLPTGEGWYCLMGMKKNGLPQQLFVETLSEVEVVVNRFLADNRDAYFGCAKVQEAGNRKKANIAHFKAFWLDLDCGAEKPFPTQQAAITRLKQFCDENTLPKPTLVNSGRGIHVYWTLTDSIDKTKWCAVAERLKELCDEQKFEVDSSVISDAARILRIPETLNFKDIENPLPVSLLYIGEHSKYEDLRALLNVSSNAVESKPFIPSRPNELTLMLLGNKVSKFKTIVEKTAAGRGCQQIANAILNQATLEEPLWRAILSIANVCEDRDVAIHKVSKGHPDYDSNEANEKARLTKGPYTCATFEKLYRAGCADCPLKGKIKSPIVIGQEIAVSTEPEPETTEPTESPRSIPVYPAPYFRGRAGGIYQHRGDEEAPLLIYEHDLVLVKRLVDPNLGECAWLRRSLPKDGVKEFSLPMSALLSRDEIRKILPAKGVITGAKQMDSIMTYLIAVAKEKQMSSKAEEMRTQFGWADGDTKIIVGDREISNAGVFYSPPSTVTNPIAVHMQPVGDFDKWKKAFNTYAEPGFEPHAFATLTAFGAPLLKFLNLKGCMINLVNNQSGTGKSTILQMVNSVIGHPDELMLQWKDTANSILHRFGVMNNFAVCIDEITKMPAEIISDLLYAASQGRGKARMKQHTNEERVNLTKWALIALTTSNSSIVDKISTLKNTFDGEMMRLMEYKIELAGNLSREEARERFDVLQENYGHAADPFFKYLVSNKVDAINLVRKVQFKLDRDVQLEAKERFWSGTTACNFAGGMIAQSLGLHDYNMKNIYRWVVPTLDHMRKEIKSPANTATALVGEFVNRHINSMLVVNGQADSRTNLTSAPLMEPRNELIIRFEPDTRLLFLVAKLFRKHCADVQFSYSDVMAELKKQHHLVEVTRKRMAKGSKVNSPAVDAIVLDCSTSDFIDMEAYVPPPQPTNP